MNLSLSLALNNLMDKDFKLASSKFHIFAPVNFISKDAIVCSCFWQCKSVFGGEPCIIAMYFFD